MHIASIHRKMKHFTDIIPLDLAEKLKEKGMPIDIDCDTFDSGTEYQRDERWCNNTYAEVFDWLITKHSLFTAIQYNAVINEYAGIVSLNVDRQLMFGLDKDVCIYEYENTWHEAAEKAIEKALTLI